MTEILSKENIGRFTKGFIPWNKGKFNDKISGFKHWNYRGATICGCGDKKYSQAKLCWQCHLKNRVPSPTQFKKGHINPNPNFKKGMTPWNVGMKGLIIGFPRGKRNTKIAGSNHYNWKGGITSENKIIRHGAEIRLIVSDSKKRDNYTCQMPRCGKRGVKLESHHIKTFRDFPDLRNELTNLITLCDICHNKTKGKESLYEEIFINIIKLK